MAQMNRVFTMAIVAQCHNAVKVWTVTNCMLTGNARSEAEAEGIGLANARSRWPEREGYYNYNCIAVEVPHALFEEVQNGAMD